MSKKRHKHTGMMQRAPAQAGALSWLAQQGKNFFARKDYLSAIQSWLAARQREDRPENLDKALAEAYFRQGQQILFRDPPTATEDLIQAARLAEADPLYAYHVALALHRQGKAQQAAEWYQTTLQRDTAFKRANYLLAVALMQDGQDAQRHPVWQTLDEAQRARLQHQTTEDPLAQGLAEAAGGRWDSARRLFEAALAQPIPRSAKGLADYYLGVIAEREGDDQKALDHWQKALDAGLVTAVLFDNLMLAYTLRAEAALADNRPAEALAIAAKGLAVQPDHKRLLDIQTQAHFEAGYSAAEQGNWRGAIAAWKQIANPSGPNARGLSANIAIAYEKLELWAEAAEAWREFVRRRPRKEGGEDWLSPEQVARLWSRVSSLYVQAGLPDEAIATLQTALKYQPDDAVVALALVRCYIDGGRLDAARNQTRRVLDKHPTNVQALVLDAEITEATDRGWRLEVRLPGMAQWEKVLETGDETYAPLARQRLVELYEHSFETQIEFGQFKAAIQAAKEGLKLNPNNHFLRARYVYALLRSKVPRAEVDRQIALIKLTDVEALHQLIDNFHNVNQDKDAAALLQKADALQKLEADFYLGIANCALGRRQTGVARTYVEEAVRRARDAEHGKRIRAEVGLLYAQNNADDEAEKIWQGILKEDPAHGPAHLYMAVLSTRQGNSALQKKHFQQAEAWARANHDADFLEQVKQFRQMLNNPLRRLLPALLDPSMLPPGLAGVLGADDLDDDVDLDDVGGMLDIMDILNNLEDFPPETDRRRRKKKKGNQL